IAGSDVEKEGFVRLNRGILYHTYRERGRWCADIKSHNSRRCGRLIVAARRRRAVGRGKLDAGRFSAGIRKRKGKFRRSKSGTTSFRDADVVNGHGRGGVVIDDRSLSKSRRNPSSRRTAEIDTESFIRLIHQIAGDRHRNGPGVGARSKRQIARG